MFETLDVLAEDPLLGLLSEYRQDSAPEKVDVGVGVYRNEPGDTPVLEAVRAAEHLLVSEQNTKSLSWTRGQ